MRILLGTLYPNLGGSNRVLLAAAKALAGEHEVIVRAPLPEATHPTPAPLPLDPLVGAAAKLRTLPRLAGAIARELAFVRRVRPDVLYVHDEPALYVYGPVAGVLRRPLVWHMHMRPGTGIKGRLRRALSDHRIAISRFSAEGLGHGAVVIRNPLLAAPPAPAAALPGGRLALTVVGAIGTRKNQALALETLALLRQRGRDAHLTLVGPEIEPAYGRALRERAATLGVSANIRFAGPLPPENVWREDAVALFPATYENQPLALLEALAGGRRFVAADIPGHREIVEDIGEDRRVLLPHDPVAFADGVEKAAASTPDPALAERVIALFAPERFESAIRAFFRQLDRGAPRW